VIIERIQDQQTVHDGFYVELGKGDTKGGNLKSSCCKVK